jgi:peptidylprolyl isomerase
LLRPLALLASLLACGCGVSASGATDMASAHDLSIAAPDMAPELYVPQGFALVPFLSAAADTHDYSDKGGPDPVLEVGKDYQAVLVTDAGRIVIDLLEAKAPNTVDSFVFLALHHYFDGIAFHRVIDGFVAQGGDPNTLDPDTSGWGAGGPGYGYGLEIDQALTYDGAGVVGMARTMDPNSNGSQFFITLAAAHNLDGQYTIFGKLTEGAAVLPKIKRGMPPVSPTRMQRVYIVAK